MPRHLVVDGFSFRIRHRHSHNQCCVETLSLIFQTSIFLNIRRICYFYIRPFGVTSEHSFGIPINCKKRNAMPGIAMLQISTEHKARPEASFTQKIIAGCDYFFEETIFFTCLDTTHPPVFLSKNNRSRRLFFGETDLRNLLIRLFFRMSTAVFIFWPWLIPNT